MQVRCLTCAGKVHGDSQEGTTTSTGCGGCGGFGAGAGGNIYYIYCYSSLLQGVGR